MTYYIAKSLSNNSYICINSNTHYNWFNSFSDIDPLNLYRFDKVNEDDNKSKTIKEWFNRLNENSMTLVLTFTRESHPELFL